MGIKACSEELHFTNSSSTLTQVTGLVSVGLPTLTRATNDSTNQASGCVETLSPALLQLGPFPFTVEYVPGNADDVLLTELMTSGAVRAFEIHMDAGAGDGSQKKITGSGFATSYEAGGGETGPGGERRSTGEFQITAVYSTANVS